MQRYEIADMLVEILPDKQMTFRKYDPFITTKYGKPDLKISIIYSNSILKPKGKILIDETIKWQYKSQTENIMVVYICEKATGKVLFLCEIDENWENVMIYYSGEVYEVEREVTGILGSILFRNSVLFHQGFVVHASAIEWNGRGILFSAPSETGKSTQAKLEAVTMLMPRCFLPYYDNNIMNIAIINFEKVISSIPVYFLECRPDMEAVELVHKCVM